MTRKVSRRPAPPCCTDDLLMPVTRRVDERVAWDGITYYCQRCQRRWTLPPALIGQNAYSAILDDAWDQ
jgi:hypothetical protein